MGTGDAGCRIICGMSGLRCAGCEGSSWRAVVVVVSSNSEMCVIAVAVVVLVLAVVVVVVVVSSNSEIRVL